MEYLKKYGLTHAPHVPQIIREEFSKLDPSQYNAVSNELMLIFTHHPQGHPRGEYEGNDHAEPEKTAYVLSDIAFLCQIHFNPHAYRIKDRLGNVIRVEELFLKHAAHLENMISFNEWLQRQSQKFQTQYSRLHSNDPEDLYLLLGFEYHGVDYAERNVSEVLQDRVNKHALRWLAKTWPSILRKIFADQFSVLMAAAWLHPPFAEDLELPDEMPPIEQLIPHGQSYSLEKYRFFRVLIQKYSYDALFEAMNKAEIAKPNNGEKSKCYSENDLKYLNIFGGGAVPKESMPADLNDDERGMWWHAMLLLSASNADRLRAPGGRRFLGIGDFTLPYDRDMAAKEEQDKQ